MCGLTGLLDVSHSGFPSKDVDLFEGLLLINSLRGRASTGVFGVNKHKQADIHKVLGNPYNLDNTVLGDWFNNRILNRYWAVAGHGRFPTQGETTIFNAHPFCHGKITLMHNGTLRNLPRLLKEHDQKFEVDSEMICWLVNKIGIKDTIKEIEGAYALIWYDASDDTYNFIRNTERPLHYGINSFNDAMVIGSEEHYIKWANSKTYERYKDVRTVPMDTHYKIGREKNKLIIDKTDIRKTYNHNYYDTSHHMRHQGYSDVWGDVEESAIIVPPFEKKKDPVTLNQTTKEIVCLSEDLHFEVGQASSVKIKETNDEETLLFGSHLESKKISVVSTTKSPSLLFRNKISAGEKVIMKAKVKSILPRVTPSAESLLFSLRIILDEAEEIKDDSKSVKSTNIVPFIPTHVHLRDDSLISKAEFVRLSGYGCLHCKGNILLKDAEECSRVILNGVSSLICGECHRVEVQKEETNASQSQQSSTLH